MTTDLAWTRPPADRVADPFTGFFVDPPERADGGLLGIPSAQALFEALEWSCRNDLYVYQRVLEGKSGPRVQVEGRSFLLGSSYDYLGLIGHPAVEDGACRAVRTFGTGTGGVRLLTGTTRLHRQFEDELARFTGTEAALTLSSGYAANLAVVSALVRDGDRIIADARVHRSIADACRLAGTRPVIFRHNDPGSLERRLATPFAGRRTLVIVEGVYSMDGDICPLPEILSLTRRYGAYLMVDEAHSFGTLGARGRGVSEHFGIDPDAVDIWTGSLSKAIPANGGFVAGARALIIYLQHEAAPFVFSAALCPASVGAAAAALRIVRAEPERRERLQHNAGHLRTRLARLGFDLGASATHVVPVMTGDDAAAYRLARALLRMGILVTPVVYPAVPRRQARLRLCVTAAQDEAMLDQIAAALARAARCDPASGADG